MECYRIGYIVQAEFIRGWDPSLPLPVSLDKAEEIALFLRPSAREEFADLPSIPDEAETGASYVVVGDLGTYAGLITDQHSRVLGADRQLRLAPRNASRR